MNRLFPILFISFILLVIDYYAFQAVKTVFSGSSTDVRQIVSLLYWTITGSLILGLFIYFFGNPDKLSKRFRTIIMVGVFTNVLSKLFVILFLFVDEIQRFGQWAFRSIVSIFDENKNSSEIAYTERSNLLSAGGLISAGIPIIAVSWGILSGAHDYRIRRKTIYLPNLPKAFDGIRIGQLSDIHAGSFHNKIAVKGGIDLLHKEKVDITFFTGDLVNNQADEMQDYMNIFNRVSAPLGTYSVLGNHDYGDYVRWPSREAKVKNLENLKTIHQLLGWQLLLNEHKVISVDGEKMAIIGIENWGAKGRFSQYGKLAEAHEGTQEVPLKLLLSHDPSHWETEVLKEYGDIDIAFAGHTHGMQFGVEIGDFKWSPIQYMYKQWAGLYQHEGQHLYVNRGFGYLGYPGRIGIPPEITVITLKKG
ncbi:metallophosphoesterase [Fulvivirgaceae bacterium BMA10]|uniref:Metallophosphoesterase n=1 Tax=Splendidivirga corallicola TaxID=3051826 RepID=A0ABT8KRS4_9BACT|nr:metallophosphoesterase [Fulvivirgaceae bacterium BMA10]